MSQLDGIEVFVKVVQCGSFSAAAKLLGMPVTTVSGKLAALEKRLGITLLHRTTRKLSITQEGEAYFSHCVRALEEVDAAEKKLFTTRMEPEGLLRITTTPDIGHMVLPPIIRNYLRAFPKTQIELILTARIVDLVGEGVDLAIRAGKLKDSSLIAKKFIDVEVFLFASNVYIKKNGFPKKPQDLKDHSLIALKSFPNPLSFVKDRKSVKIPFQSRIVVDDMEAVKVFVMDGDGLGILPSLICDQELKSGKLIKILPEWSLNFGFGSKGHFSFVYPPQRYISPKIQSFIQMAGKTL